MGAPRPGHEVTRTATCGVDACTCPRVRVVGTVDVGLSSGLRQKAALFFCLVQAVIVSPDGSRAGDEDRAASTAANNAFGVNLYSHLAEKHAGKNFAVSPLSMMSALLIVAEGARGATAVELGTTLCLPPTCRNDPMLANEPWNLEPIHRGMGQLSLDLQAGRVKNELLDKEIAKLRAEVAQADRDYSRPIDEGSLENESKAWERFWSARVRLDSLLTQVDPYVVRIATAMWRQQGDDWRPQFDSAIQAYYGDGVVRSVDFRKQHGTLHEVINAWADEATDCRSAAQQIPTLRRY